MIKVEYVNAMGTTVVEPLSWALDYAAMAWDAVGVRINIFDLGGNEIAYHFNARGKAVLDAIDA